MPWAFLGVLALAGTVAVAGPASAEEQQLCLTGTKLTRSETCVTASRIEGGMEYSGYLKDDLTDDRMTNLYIRLWGWNGELDEPRYLRTDSYQIQEDGYPASRIDVGQSHQLPVDYWQVGLCSRLLDEAETDCVWTPMRPL